METYVARITVEEGHEPPSTERMAALIEDEFDAYFRIPVAVTVERAIAVADSVQLNIGTAPAEEQTT